MRLLLLSLLSLLLILCLALAGQNRSAHWQVGLAGHTTFKIDHTELYSRSGIFGRKLPPMSLLASWYPYWRGISGLGFNAQVRVRYSNHHIKGSQLIERRGGRLDVFFDESYRERGFLCYYGLSYQLEGFYPKDRFWTYMGGGAAFHLPILAERTLVRQEVGPSHGYPDIQVRRENPLVAVGWYASLGFRFRISPAWLLATEFRFEALLQTTDELLATPRDYIETDQFRVWHRVLYDNRILLGQVQLLYEW